MSIATLPCPKCDSSDAFKRYPDGGAKCWSCGYTEADDEYLARKGRAREECANSNKENTVKEKKDPPKFICDGVVNALPERAISDKICKKWRYQTAQGYNKNTEQREPCEVANYYDDNGTLVGQKLKFPKKSPDEKNNFTCIGTLPPLYGKWLWKDGGKMIVITEGELDALAVSEADNGKWPVVSISNGAQAAKRSLELEKKWLEDNFEEIILMFDMDKQGQDAAIECSKMFSHGKCKIASLSEKDANEMLKKGKVKELINAKFNAKEYRPEGIVCAADLVPLLDKKPEWGADLPWQPLTDWTYGLKDGQLIVLVSGSGMGKTEFFKSTIAHLLNTKKDRIGIVFLEEEAKDTLLKLAGKTANKRFDSPEFPCDKEERDTIIAKMVADDRIDYFDHFGCNDYETVRDVVRNMVVNGGCKYVFLDHITAFTDGKDNANRIMEKAMNELASMTRELKFNLHCVSHIRGTMAGAVPAEAGGRITIDDAKGSSAIKQWANVVYSLERNTQSEEEDIRNTSTIRMLKIREAGQNVGRYFKIKYIPVTGELKLIGDERSEVDIMDVA